MDQRQKMSPNNNNKASSGLSNIMKQAGNGSLNDQERELKFPMDPRTAVINFSKYLLDFEKTEILDYDCIYWFNLSDRKAQKGPPTTPDGVDNNGFDNDKNEYITEEGCHIAYRFEIVGRLGKGSFGQVFRCYDHKLQEYAGLKILRNKKRLYK
jgi:dual specificity tyrosine-phosphorylation-regulated kinase 2/3/4